MKHKVKPNQQERGITLIALIITIIVLVILAAVTLNSIFGSNIIGLATNGAINYATETTRENEILNQTASIIKDAIGENIPENPGEDEGEEPTTGIEFGNLTEEERDKLVGKYVDYTPVSGTFSDHVGSTYSGDTGNSNTTLSTITSLKWRILDTSDNTLTLISDKIANVDFTLEGPDGYNNGVLLLNNACKAMYSNSSLGATGRSLNIDDIEDYMTYNKNSNSSYGREYSSSYRYYPKIFADEKTGAPNGTYGSKYGLSDQDSYVTGTANGNGSFKGKFTYYTFAMSTSTMKNRTYVDLFSSSTAAWLASRCVSYGGFWASFNMFVVSGGAVGAGTLYYSNNNGGSGSCAVHPVVEINLSSVNLGATGDGAVDTPYSIEAK